jgi:predicted lipase
MLFFEQSFLLEIQLNYKNWFLKQKLVGQWVCTWVNDTFHINESWYYFDDLFF